MLRTSKSPKRARSAMCVGTYNTTLSQHLCFGGASSPPSTSIDGKESPQHAVLHSTVTVVTIKVSHAHAAFYRVWAHTSEHTWFKLDSLRHSRGLNATIPAPKSTHNTVCTATNPDSPACSVDPPAPYGGLRETGGVCKQP